MKFNLYGATVGGFVLLGVFALIAVATILKGWVLTYLWSWFIVPNFGLPELSIVSAIGICMVAGFLTSKYTGDIKREKEDDPAKLFGTLFSYMIRMPLVMLGIGWIVHLFM